jgi:hypothetical protein
MLPEFGGANFITFAGECAGNSAGRIKSVTVENRTR